MILMVGQNVPRSGENPEKGTFCLRYSEEGVDPGSGGYRLGASGVHLCTALVVIH